MVSSGVDVSNTQLKKVIQLKTLEIMKLLREKEQMSFSELMFEARLNPSSLSDSLKTLIEFGIVAKVDSAYVLTDKGVVVLSTFTKLIEVIKG